MEEEKNESAAENSEIEEEISEVKDKTEVVGVRFRRNAKIYHFDPAGIELETGDMAVVETARGLEMGEIVTRETIELLENTGKQFKPVVRKATDEDVKGAEKMKQEEGKAAEECTRLMDKLNLPMKLISVEYNVDGSRLTVFFSAEGRIDFRELVRELSRSLKVRVEMRQIGPRDEAKMLGGFGRCGRPLCCATFLNDLNPVSIKMAKEQGLPLSPMKISGLCGRLLCCLGYEYEQYRAIREKMPKNGKPVMTPKGEGTVVGNNPIEETVIVELEGGARIKMTLEELKNEGKGKQKEEDKEKGKDKGAGRRRGQRR